MNEPREDQLLKYAASFMCVLSVLALLPIVVFAQAGDVKAKLKSMKPQDYPTQSIEFVVAFPAGGGMDFTARILAKHVEKYIDSRVIVVNKPGGGGIIGNTYRATQAANDGYTVGIPSTRILSDDLLKAKGAWSYKNLQALAFITEEPVTWIVSTTGPLKDMALNDVIQMSTQKPDTLKVAVIPDISFQWLAETVERMAIMNNGNKKTMLVISALGRFRVAGGWGDRSLRGAGLPRLHRLPHIRRAGRVGQTLEGPGYDAATGQSDTTARSGKSRFRLGRRDGFFRCRRLPASADRGSRQPEQCQWTPNVLLDITEVWDLKRKAFECMEAQKHLWEYYTRVGLQRGVQASRNSNRKVTYAEGYQRIFPQVADELL